MKYRLCQNKVNKKNGRFVGYYKNDQAHPLLGTEDECGVIDTALMDTETVDELFNGEALLVQHDENNYGNERPLTIKELKSLLKKNMSALETKLAEEFNFIDDVVAKDSVSDWSSCKQDEIDLVNRIKHYVNT